MIGETNSEVLPLEAWSDAVEFTVYMDDTQAENLQVSPDYNPLTPLTATWVNVNKVQNGVGASSRWDTGNSYTVKFAGKAFRYVIPAVVVVERHVSIWKSCLVGA